MMAINKEEIKIKVCSEILRKKKKKKKKSMERPNRSDIHISPEEKKKIEEKTRDYFDGLAPNRHTKPQRSEYSLAYVDAFSTTDHNHEYLQFQTLQKDSQKLDYNANGVKEEFVETEYYKDLNCVDKQHHKTGSGFIKTENTNDISFHLKPDSSTITHASCKGNPATNDWIPLSTNTEQTSLSEKPNRSDN